MDYNMIHACVNDCVLYRGELEFSLRCPKCKEPRYKEDTINVPRKVLRHFPLRPRIERLFCSPSLASLMDWHAKNKSTDGIMRIPADCVAFQHIDDTWKDFKTEPRNLKLGVGLDGINPFSNQSSRWSTWPVALVNYNIPPFMSIRKEHLLLSLLIPGKYLAFNMLEWVNKYVFNEINKCHLTQDHAKLKILMCTWLP